MKAIYLSLAAISLAAVSGAANAAFINGSVGFSDGLCVDCLPVGDDSVVSELVLIEHADVNGDPIDGITTSLSGGTGDFAGIGAEGLISDIDLVTIGGSFIEAGGFTFEILSITDIDRSEFTCNAAGLCQDELNFSITGAVSGNGFDTTEFIANYGAEGSCLGTTAGCESGYVGTYSGTIIATGMEVPVPAPGVLTLFGIGAIALGASRKTRRS